MCVRINIREEQTYEKNLISAPDNSLICKETWYSSGSRWWLYECHYGQDCRERERERKKRKFLPLSQTKSFFMIYKIFWMDCNWNWNRRTEAKSNGVAYMFWPFMCANRRFICTFQIILVSKFVSPGILWFIYLIAFFDKYTNKTQDERNKTKKKTTSTTAIKHIFIRSRIVFMF